MINHASYTASEGEDERAEHNGVSLEIQRSIDRGEFEFFKGGPMLVPTGNFDPGPPSVASLPWPQSENTLTVEQLRHARGQYLHDEEKYPTPLLEEMLIEAKQKMLDASERLHPTAKINSWRDRFRWLAAEACDALFPTIEPPKDYKPTAMYDLEQYDCVMMGISSELARRRNAAEKAKAA